MFGVGVGLLFGVCVEIFVEGDDCILVECEVVFVCVEVE